MELIQTGTATIPSEEYVQLRELKANFDEKVAELHTAFEKAKKEIEVNADKIQWGDRIQRGLFTYINSTTFDSSSYYTYTGKDEAIRRLTNRLNEVLKVPEKPTPRATLAARLRFLFTGRVQ